MSELNVYAAVEINPTIFSPSKNFATAAALINTFIPNILIIAGVIFLIIIIIAGFQMVIAGQADPQKMQKTQKTLTTAVVGLILIVTAYWLVNIIQTITGVNIINPPETL